jgi:hypothetical protein
VVDASIGLVVGGSLAPVTGLVLGAS